MRLRPARSLMLTLALVLGQWLVLAHAFEHPALQADALCQICAHAQGLDGGALAPKLTLPHTSALAEAPVVAAALPARAGTHKAYDIRGPPQLAIVTV
ncbi:MAG: hypothetical protein ACREVL_04435 [Solimonas sp.]